MKFLWDLFDSFVPNEKNGYKPHFFRVKIVLAVAAVVVVLGAGSILLQNTLSKGSDSLAAVISSAIVTLTNTDRAENNLAVLSVNPVLERAAQLKAEDMALKSYFAHTSPEGVTPWYWFEEAGYNFVFAGENLAVRFTDSIDVVRAWMDSAGHRANILNEHFTEIGIGIAEGMFEGKPTVFVVQMFGTPAPSYAPFPKEATVAPVAVATVQDEPVEEDAPAVQSAAIEDISAQSATLETETEPAPSPEIIFENETFIVVANEVATASPLTVSPSTDMQSALIHTLVTSPSSVTQMVYMVLATLVGIALIVMVVLEARHQHLSNVLLGLLLLVLMAGFLFFGQSLIEPLLVV